MNQIQQQNNRLDSFQVFIQVFPYWIELLFLVASPKVDDDHYGQKESSERTVIETELKELREVSKSIKTLEAINKQMKEENERVVSGMMAQLADLVQVRTLHLMVHCT